MDVTLILGFIAAIAITVIIVYRRRGRSRAPRPMKRGADPLVTACFGDRAKANRLAEYEQRRMPGITMAEARDRALDRLRSDRSR